MRSARLFVPASLFVTVALGMTVNLGCGSSDSPKSPSLGGDGGATATPGGSGGASASAGGNNGAGTGGSAGDAGTPPGSDSGAPAGECNIPCLANINKDCVPMGACVEQSMEVFGTKIGANRCYDNKVKIITAFSLQPPGVTVTHRKPDGSVCFSMEGALTTTDATITWKDAAGMVIARGKFDTATMKATSISCGDQSFDPSSATSCAAAQNLPTIAGTGTPPSGCTPGACM